MATKEEAIYYNMCGIYKKYHDKTFEQFVNDPEALKQVEAYLKKLPEMREKGIGLYLWGANGVGKTHLMACAFKQLIEKRYRVKVVHFSDLIASFVEGWYNKSEKNVVDELKRVDFLCIEEIGKEFKSKEGELARSTFDNVIRYRIQMSKPTWITSNCKPSQIKTTYSEDISSMLKEGCIAIQVLGEDYRGIINSKNEKLL